MFRISVAIFMMPLLPRDPAEPEPEADSEAAEETVEPLRTFHKEAVYCFLSVCIGHTLRRLDDTEYDGGQDKAEALNGIWIFWKTVLWCLREMASPQTICRS